MEPTIRELYRYRLADPDYGIWASPTKEKCIWSLLCTCRAWTQIEFPKSVYPRPNDIFLILDSEVVSNTDPDTIFISCYNLMECRTSNIFWIGYANIISKQTLQTSFFDIFEKVEL